MEWEDRIMSVVLIMIVVGVAMMLFAGVFIFVAIGITLLKDGTVGEAHPGPAGSSGAAEARIATRLDGADDRIVWQVKAYGKCGCVERSVADADCDDGEWNGTNVGDDNLIRRGNPTMLPDRLDGGTRNVAKLLTTERSEGEVGGNSGDGGGDTGPERRENGTTGHDPLGNRHFFHRRDYSKKAP